eukprot:jgi/Hompol1/6329/HPOL_002251-RA
MLTANTDLISLFGLKPLYDKLIRPPPSVSNASSSVVAAASQAPKQASPSSNQNHATGSQTAILTPQVQIDPTYLPHIADLPGKPDLSRDTGLRDLLFGVKRGESMRPREFDYATLEAAFTLQPGLIPDTV